jgi:starch synthase
VASGTAQPEASAAPSKGAASGQAKPAKSAARKPAPAVSTEAPAASQSARKAPAARKAAAARTARPAAPPDTGAAPAPRALSIVLVASEVAPLAGTGDLADVVGTAATALGALGHRVTVVLPKYAGIATPGAPVDRFAVSIGARDEEACCYEMSLGPNARAILVEHGEFFDREFLYGDGQNDYPDNPRRFAFLSRAALEFVAREGERVDVIQAFDWQTGLVPVFLQAGYRAQPALANATSVFTIHDVAFQGLFAPDWGYLLGLDPALFSTDGLEYWGRLSFLKGGVNLADVVSTLSGEYQARLLTPGRGAGFEGVLAARGAAFRAVVSGDDAAEVLAEPARFGARLAEFYAEAVAGRTGG